MPATECSPGLIEKCVGLFREDYGKNWKNKSRPYAGIPEMLDALVAGDIRLAVLSNKPHEYTQQCIEEILPSWNFDVILGQRSQTPAKPDPSGAFEIAEYLEIPPRKFIFVGDTSVDMQTAVAAGMFPMGVLWGFRGEDELRQHGAAALVRTPGEIVTFLEQTI